LIHKKYVCNVYIFQVTENLDYDEKVGFSLISPSIIDSGDYSCEANRNNINESRKFTVFINREFVMLLTWCWVI
jgi:hypothetical protein